MSHVAIYVGNGTFVHAEWYGYGVTVTAFTNDQRDGRYWDDHYLAANRFTNTR
jgi:cell wall-associated NlpC family hydrolase